MGHIIKNTIAVFGITSYLGHGIDSSYPYDYSMVNAVVNTIPYNIRHCSWLTVLLGGTVVQRTPIK